MPSEVVWKQVWVTPNATRPGGLEEKTPIEGGRVRQVVETSSDGGDTWEVGFDAVYVPTSGGTSPRP